MEHQKFVSLLRVSTPKQAYGKEKAKYMPEEAEAHKQTIISSGLASQKNDCDAYIRSQNGIHLKQFIEVESGMEKRFYPDGKQPTVDNMLDKRPVCLEAIRYAKENNATIVVAYQSRLTRNSTLLNLLLTKGVKFVAATAPQDGTLIMQIKAAVDQETGATISRLTSSAIRAKIARDGYWHTKETMIENWRKMRRAVGKKKSVARFNHPATVYMMELAYKMKTMGLSWKVIIKFFNQYGVKNHKGNKVHYTKYLIDDFSNFCKLRGYVNPTRNIYRQRIDAIEIFTSAQAAMHEYNEQQKKQRQNTLSETAVPFASESFIPTGIRAS